VSGKLKNEKRAEEIPLFFFAVLIFWFISVKQFSEIHWMKFRESKLKVGNC
jgi:hypothetical protein